MVGRLAAFLAGAAVVLATVASAVKTVIVPRAEAALLTRFVFVWVRKPFDALTSRAPTWEAADRIMSRFGPFALLALPFVWVTVVIVAFAPMYWAVGIPFPHDA